MKNISAVIICFALCACTASGSGNTGNIPAPAEKPGTVQDGGEAGGFTVTADGVSFYAAAENNEAARAFLRIIRDAGGTLAVAVSDYGGFEKVGSLGQALPASDRRMNAQAGDIMLYNSRNVVLFYGTNTWSYTRLGTVSDLSGWEAALKNSSTVYFSMK